MGGDQVQHDEHAADAAVPVLERMDRLELVVHQRARDERGVQAGVVGEALPIGHQGRQPVGRRRHEAGVLDVGAGGTDPDLDAAEVAAADSPAAHALQQSIVRLVDELPADGEVVQPLLRVLQGAHVVEHFPHVVLALPARGRLEAVEVRLGGLRALNAGGQHCLAPDEGLREEIGIGQRFPHSREHGHLAGGLVEEPDQGRVEQKFARQRAGNEGHAALRDRDDRPRRAIAEVGGAHVKLQFRF